jgi:hypothetical protein
MAVVWPKLEIRVVPAEEFCRNERAVEEKKVSRNGARSPSGA